MRWKPRRRSQKRVYPTPAERELIIQRRDDLLKELVEMFVTRPPTKHRAAVSRLAQTYGAAEVQLVLRSFQERGHRPLVGEEPGLYREYRLVFARFGGERRFLSKPEFEEISYEHASLFARREFKSLLRRGPGKRERELRHLLLTEERMWNDIFPPAPPPRPPDFAAPPAGSYPTRLKELLKLGWKTDERVIAARARKVAGWKPLIPDLERMVLDEGLLSGWPADPSAWAPLHALQLLGRLRAHPSAGGLLALMDRENDWLSDLLPSVWAEMGPQAAEPLWAYVLDRQHNPEQRGNVMLGLWQVAQKHPGNRAGIVEGLHRLLDEAPTEDGEANAYIAYALGQLRAVETIPALRRAYQAGKIDPKVVAWEDLMAWMEEG